MKTLHDVTGEKFGKLTAIEYVGKASNNATLWRCQCDCGNEVVARLTNLRTGNTTSCGCVREKKEKKMDKHNNSSFREQMYGRYRRVMWDCCDEWIDFQNFCKWAEESGYEEGCILKKVNSNLLYQPDNCYWYKKDTENGFNSKEFCERWDKSVNRIRAHYGLEQLGVAYE